MLLPLISISRSRERPSDDQPDGRSLDFGMSAGAWGMAVFLASLVMLFAGGIVLLISVRLDYPSWPPPGLPPLHGGFLVATGFLLLTSLALHIAARAVRRERLTRTRKCLAVAIALVAAFVAIQGWNWAVYLDLLDPARAWRIAGLLYFLTGLHALHVIGGIVPLVLAWNGLRRGVHCASRCRLIRFTAAYWHLLDAVWIAALVVLLIPG